MTRYQNKGGNSGILSYEIGSDYISVKFSGNYRVYTYSYIGAGQRHVDKMKGLATKGMGLNSYINKYVRELYDF